MPSASCSVKSCDGSTKGTNGHQGNSNAGKWTAEQDDALRKLHSEGCSGAQAAADINREFGTAYSRSAIIGRSHRLGLTQPLVVKRMQKKAAAKVDNPPKPKPIKTFVAEAFVARAADVVPRHLPLLDLKPDDCRYPYGNGPFSFCGHGKTAGSSYCFEHDCLTRRA
jgi:GcrA cell cycle regulator